MHFHTFFLNHGIVLMGSFASLDTHTDTNALT